MAQVAMNHVKMRKPAAKIPAQALIGKPLGIMDFYLRMP